MSPLPKMLLVLAYCMHDCTHHVPACRDVTAAVIECGCTGEAFGLTLVDGLPPALAEEFGKLNACRKAVM